MRNSVYNFFSVVLSKTTWKKQVMGRSLQATEIQVIPRDSTGFSLEMYEVLKVHKTQSHSFLKMNND